MKIEFNKINVVSYGDYYSRGAKALYNSCRVHISGNPSIVKRKNLGTKWYSPSGNSGGKILVVNWGSSPALDKPWEEIRILNRDVSISDKKRFFMYIEDRNAASETETKITIPVFTSDNTVANTWLSDGIPVVARELLNSHSGKGIKIFQPGETIGDPMKYLLYTEYVKKKDEYRVHISSEFGVQYIQKKLRLANLPEGVTDPYKIRNHQNGWVYSIVPNSEVPTRVYTQALLLKKALGDRLDFYAADIIYNQSQNKAYVLEVNTAPGIEGRSINYYTGMIKKYYDKGIVIDDEEEEPETEEEESQF